MKIEISCGGIVYQKKDGQYLYLIIKNLYGKHYGFPKGHVEKDEEFWETATREILEETGIKAEIVSTNYVTNSYFVSADTFKDVHYFLAKAETTDIRCQASEVEQAAWLPAKDILMLLTYENDKQIFMQLTKELK